MGFRQKIQTIKSLRKQNVSWIVIFYFGLEYLGLNKFSYFISIFLANLYVLHNVKPISRRFRKNEVPQNKMIIVETGVLGDCMLVIDAFKELENYCKLQKMELYIICSHAMSKIFNQYAKVNANFICFKNRDVLSKKELAEIKRKVSGVKFRYMFRRDGHPSALRLSSLIFAQKALYYSYDVSTRSVYEKHILPHVYTDIKRIEKDVFIPSVWKEMLHDVGMKDYKTKIGKIYVPDSTFHIPNKSYVLICPEASNRTRTVDIEKIEAIVKYLKTNYSFAIAISSDCRDKNYKLELDKLVQEYELESFLGTTTLDHFIYLVSRASLVISCDTGAVHLAANSSVPCICLKGYWDKPYFLPYHFDLHKDFENLPIVLYPRNIPSCAYCGSRGKFADSKECSDRLLRNLSVKCNFDISNEDIFNTISNVLGEYNVR